MFLLEILSWPVTRVSGLLFPWLPIQVTYDYYARNQNPERECH